MDDIGCGPVGLDTPVFIYLVERHPGYLPILRPVFEAIDAGRLVGVTTPLTLFEVLVVPHRHGDLELAERYEVLLTRSRGLRMAELGLETWRAAARIRALTGLKTPDALQLAAASGAGCTALLTNDRDLPVTRDLDVLLLSEYAG